MKSCRKWSHVHSQPRRLAITPSRSWTARSVHSFSHRPQCAYMHHKLSPIYKRMNSICSTNAGKNITHRLSKVGRQVNERPGKFHARFPATSFVSEHHVINARYVQCLDGYQRRLLEHRLHTKSRQSQLVPTLAFVFRDLTGQVNVKDASQHLKRLMTSPTSLCFPNMYNGRKPKWKYSSH